MPIQFKARLSLWMGSIVLTFATLLMAGCGPPMPTPTPTPTPEPFIPSGVPDARLGMTWISSFYGDVLAQGNEHLAVAAGATWDRWPFQWWYIEPTPGSYQFDLYTAPDGLQINYAEGVARDEANGLQVLGTLNGWAPHPGYGLDEWRANGEATGTDLWAYDPDSGLTSLTVECSPARTYDLSWTQPGVHSAVDV